MARAAKPATRVEVEAAEVAGLLARIVRGVFAVLDGDALARLPLAQLRVCLILRSGRQSISSLSRELGVSLSAMTQIADRLQRAGLISRRTSPTDRRIKLLELTPRASAMMQSREGHRAQRVGGVLAGLPVGERKAIVSAFRTFAASCEAAGSHTNNGRGTARDLVDSRTIR